MSTHKLTALGVLMLLLPSLRGGERPTIAFIENKRQWEEVVKFKSEMRGGALFFETNSVTCVFYDPEYLEKIAALKSNRIFGKNTKSAREIKMDSVVECYAYRMHFENADKNAVIKGHLPFDEYHNYYLGADPERWSTNVKKYEKIEYCGIYKGINLFFYEKDLAHKYEFRIAAGTDAEQIVMRYEGADRLFLRKGSLIIKIGKHETEERKPFAYQIDERGNKTEIPCDFALDGEKVRFALGNYDRTKELIIDPVLIFSSYSGSSADNWGFTATYDNAGNLYGGGTVANAGYPTTVGCYSTAYGGGSGVHRCDIAITKFSADGTQRLYSTYLGGESNDVPHSMIVSNNDELYLLATTSSVDYPTTANAYDRTFRNGPSIANVPTYPPYPVSSPLTNGIEYPSGACVVVSRFDAGGTQLLSSTFFGGSGTDGLSMDTLLIYNYSDEFRGEIQLDASNNVYIVSPTTSTDLPTTPSVFQPIYGGGSQDGFIAKFSYNLQNLLWCSYFGGAAADAIYSVVVDKNNNLYICGGTTSNNIPGTSFSSIQRNQPGGVDGFVSKIAANGNSIINTTYYGRAGYDQTYLVTLDRAENVYVMGQTDTTAAVWVQNAAWSNGRGQFVSKLSNNLSNVLWSTSFGSSRSTPDISPTALMVDICGNIHISGWGAALGQGQGGNLSTNGLPLTGSAIQPNTDGSDFYFISIEKDASNLLYATYFGGVNLGEHVDGGTSRFDKKGTIYQAVCAGCGGSMYKNNFPTTPGVVSRTNNSTNCNLGVIKLDYELQSVIADFSAPTQACIPVVNPFINYSQSTSGRATYHWDFGDSRTSTDSAPNISYSQSGTYIITLIVTDSSSCNIADTVQREMTILANKLDTIPAKYTCKGDPVQIGRPPASNTTYDWVPKIGLSNYNISNPIFLDTISRLYTLYVSNSQCTDTLMQWVYVIDFPRGEQRTKYGCLGDSLQLDANTAQGASSFVFSNYPTLRDTLNVSTAKSYIEVLLNQNTSTYYVYRSNGFCHATDTIAVYAASFNISIDSVPHLCSGDTVKLIANVFNSMYGTQFSYQWSPNTAVVGSVAVSNPRITLKDSAFVYVTVTNEHGCTRKDSILIGVSNLKTTHTLKDISCFGLTDGSISVGTTGGAPPYDYRWSNTSNNTNVIIDLRQGNYTVTISDRYNCSISQTFHISEPSKLSVHLEDTVGLVFCDDASTGQALAVGSGGIAPYHFSWISGDTTAFIDGLYPGNYFLLLTDQNGCEDSIRFIVRDTSDMEVEAHPNGISCYGVCDGNIFIEIITAAEPYSIAWRTGETANFRDSLCAGSYDVLITDYQRCRRRLFPIVDNIAPITIDNTVIVHPYCNGMKDGSITVTASGGNPPYKYYWDGDAKEGSNVLSGLTESGTYTLHITDRKGCEFDTVIVLQHYDTLSAIAQITHAPCEEVCLGKASVLISGGAKPYSYEWSNGGTNSAIDSLCQGEYWVVVQDSNLCEIKVSVQIELDSTIFYKKVMAWADTTEIYRSLSVTLYGTDLGNDFSYQWSPADGLPTPKGTKTTAKPNDTTIYTYTVTDKYGCQKSDTLRIIVKDVFCDESDIFVPNAFSPNGDDINDVLYVRGETLLKIDFAVYDRWGERVFSTTDTKVGWDGTYKGKPCEPGVYVYYLSATCIGEAEFVKKGNITLMR
ncbi:MAG: gliding motility-associated C-terminal domain-containing protein [Lentimicrobiaceae bacterium]|nr:gliding motility-associated C-terminal domain-containing protein [Lentimicrobiaceae bacterium]